ncbi:hypothetical protein BU16DRAFT_563902 [Lophium mytilinum]|uniref:Uncharacterized protein n=1 Tax=Lophium mytilinum TaxID=390894 RepID=A0A6A6QKT2_9PEZI|nr:hypothetical protein BU16DRAFT_563902 [Lophium mytilinum]
MAPPTPPKLSRANTSTTDPKQPPDSVSPARDTPSDHAPLELLKNSSRGATSSKDSYHLASKAAGETEHLEAIERTKSLLLALPRKLRDMIYAYAAASDGISYHWSHINPSDGRFEISLPNLCLANRQLYTEATLPYIRFEFFHVNNGARAFSNWLGQFSDNEGFAAMRHLRVTTSDHKANIDLAVRCSNLRTLGLAFAEDAKALIPFDTFLERLQLHRLFDLEKLEHMYLRRNEGVTS